MDFANVICITLHLLFTLTIGQQNTGVCHFTLSAEPEIIILHILKSKCQPSSTTGGPQTGST